MSGCYLGVTLLGQMGLLTCLQTGLLGLMLLWLWQTLLEWIDLLELMFLGQTGLLRQTLFGIIGLLEWTLFKHTGSQGRIGVLQ